VPSDPTVAPRIERIAGGDPARRALIERMVSVSRDGLPGMFRPEHSGFAHTRRRTPDGRIELRGENLRYGAIVLLGARHLPEAAQREIFGGADAFEHCGALLGRAASIANLGDQALLVWAAAELRHPDLGHGLTRLLELLPAEGAVPTVELAWTLSALAAAGSEPRRAASVRDRLIRAFSTAAGVFPHGAGPGAGAGLRGHVACFADQVYPIQALARHHRVTGDAEALAAAARCAERICEQQGAAGQWWWHYDARTGRVIEGYPVYSVHQDAMGPMALLDLAEAGGPDFADAVRRGVDWMREAPEVGHSLIDDANGVIWRKVARRDPRKLVRGLRAGSTRLHPALRLGWLDAAFPPTVVDWESRPYHLGWVLHTWLGGA
jgi:hypothetical protein